MRSLDGIDILLVRKLFQTDAQAARIKNAVCKKCVYLDAPKNTAIQNRTCSYGAENGICRMCSAFTCIYRGYFKPRNWKCDVDRIKAEIDEIIEESENPGLILLWNNFKKGG